MNYNLFDSRTVTQTMLWMCQILGIFLYQVKLYCWSIRWQFVAHALLKSCKMEVEKKEPCILWWKKWNYTSTRSKMVLYLLFISALRYVYWNDFHHFRFFSSSSSLHLQLSIRCEVYLMLLVVTYHCEFAWSRLTSEVRSKVRLISFKPSWAPLWQGCGATTDTISPYSVVEREKKAPIAHHMPDRPGTHRLPPLPLLFLVFSTLCVSYCLSLCHFLSPLRTPFLLPFPPSLLVTCLHHLHSSRLYIAAPR